VLWRRNYWLRWSLGSRQH